MAKCTECNQVLSVGAVVDVDRLEAHRLWKHPTSTDIAVVQYEIGALGTQLQLAFVRGDWLEVRRILNTLHERVLRAMTYADLEATKAAA
ncbi:hypothetical protein ACFXG4_03765 [Nocardia sp. NPDC059246]|uniref:hypothetical protein n=1 Tax=unclassified Nocardia TaxID=2637762 RepID=UPI0036AC3048